MKSLRIGMVLSDPPLPNGTAAGRVFYPLVRSLVARGHRVTAFVSCGSSADMCAMRRSFPPPLYDVRCYRRPFRTGLRAKWQTMREPFSYMFSNDFRADLARQSGQFDVLHLEDLFSGWLGIHNSGPTLLSVLYLPSVDLRGDFPTSARKVVERVLMKRAESRILSSFKFFRTVSPELVQPVLSVNPTSHVTPIPINLDLQLYPFVPDKRRSRRPLVSLVGSMRWQPSYSAAVRLLSRLYPQIKQRVPSARFQIVGWSARSALREYLHLPDVEILEDVPDARPFLERATVLLYAPRRGSGTKVKVMEAMALGVPVVTTRDGVEGLPAVDGAEAAIGDDDEGLIERTVAILRDRSAQNRQRRAAREMLESRCSPDLTAELFEQLYARMVKTEVQSSALVFQGIKRDLLTETSPSNPYEPRHGF